MDAIRRAQAPTPQARELPSVDTYGQLSQPDIGPEPNSPIAPNADTRRRAEEYTRDAADGQEKRLGLLFATSRRAHGEHQ